MVKEILIPKENKAQIEEVREIENETRLETPLVEKVEVNLEKSSREDQKEGAKDIVGGTIGTTSLVNPEVGVVAGGVSKAVGKVAEGIGKATDNEDLKDAGEVYSEGANKPLEKAGETVEKVGEGVKDAAEQVGDKLDELFS
jgi:uncharacterized protein YjbJ (UPF0337 family)